MKKIIYILGFIVMVLAQWFIPGSMIYEQEITLETGTAYKFKTRPIDPSDPFRGKYIVLNYEVDEITAQDLDWNSGEEVFISIANDSLGFAKAIAAHKTSEVIKGDYVAAEVRSYYDGKLHFDLPFDRFYMKETKAKNAEIGVREAQRDTKDQICYAEVFVHEGTAVLDNIFINDVAIKDFAKEE